MLSDNPGRSTRTKGTQIDWCQVGPHEAPRRCCVWRRPTHPCTEGEHFSHSTVLKDLINLWRCSRFCDRAIDFELQWHLSMFWARTFFIVRFQFDSRQFLYNACYLFVLFTAQMLSKQMYLCTFKYTHFVHFVHSVPRSRPKYSSRIHPGNSSSWLVDPTT